MNKLQKIFTNIIASFAIALPAIAGDKEMCLDKIRTHNTKAVISKIEKIDISDYYRIVDRKKLETQKLINTACSDIISRLCLDTRNYWNPVLKLYDDRVLKVKSFALENETNYYRITTKPYRYVCGVSKTNKVVAVVDND